MSVRLSREDELAVVTIDRPDAMNAFTPGTAAELHETVEAALETDDTAAVVLEGAGDRAFCTGADLERFAEAIETGDAVQVVSRVSGTMNDVIVSIVDADVPVVACLNGAAAGGGLGLALACDLRVAADTAVLAPAFLSAGVSPDGGTTWFLPRMVGLARAREILLGDERFTAQAALETGLVTEVVDADRVRKRARSLAREIAQGPAAAIAGAKSRLLDQQASLAEHLAFEQQATALSAETVDFEEGVRAFLEKREPEFG